MSPTGPREGHRGSSLGCVLRGRAKAHGFFLPQFKLGPAEARAPGFCLGVCRSFVPAGPLSSRRPFRVPVASESRHGVAGPGSVFSFQVSRPLRAQATRAEALIVGALCLSPPSLGSQRLRSRSPRGGRSRAGFRGFSGFRAQFVLPGPAGSPFVLPRASFSVSRSGGVSAGSGSSFSRPLPPASSACIASHP